MSHSPAQIPLTTSTVREFDDQVDWLMRRVASHPPSCANRSLTKWPQWGTMAMMQTVVETRRFAARAEKFLSESERYALIDFLASAPLRGDVLAGTGGIRKVRFARGGRGKSGGVRVIYYFYTAAKPIYLLEIFGKNEKANLAVAERNALAKVAAEIKQQLQRRQK